MGEFGIIDLHMHSTVSDGTDTPEELLERVREAGIGLFALTDHDAVKGCGMIRCVRRADDPQFLNGVEFSCHDEKGKYHVLGYGYDPESPSMRHIIERGHSLRMKKVAARLEFIRTAFGFDFPDEEVRQLLNLDNPGKPHIGNLMVKYGYAADKDQAIDEFLNRTKIRSDYIRPEEAIAAILQGGGIPILAHPPFGSGNELILGDEMDQRLRRLIDYGLCGMECFYSGFTPRLRSEMLAFAQKYALYVTAGSDYHGSNKLVILGKTGFDTTKETPDGMRRFLERVSRE